MATIPPEIELAEPLMLQWLSMLGVDVNFVRGSGDTLYFLDAAGTEVPVIDYAGGYGALILGHNHPEIVRAARDFLDSGRPTLAQASRQPDASRVASMLDGIIVREFGAGDPYFSVFSNSGAESVEVALKHAEFDRVLKAQALRAEVTAHVEEARSALGDGTATLDPADQSIEALADRVLRRLEEAEGAAPLLLTMEGSFHGKLIGSVQLTYNHSFRTPFAALATNARFVPFDAPEQLVKIIEECRRTVLDLKVRDGRITVVERDFPIFCAFVMEVIQGEGGIKVVSREAADQISRACASVDCPIVVDEIQSGMGRTGAFFASSHIGLKADYFTLAKGLGGGLVKAAVTLISGARYRQEFELVHSSTFAKDSFSSTVALRTLELLEADDGAAYRQAAHWGGRLAALFAELRDEFPDVVKEYRGVGLMLGLEFQDQSGSTASSIREAAQADLLGYALSGYLFRTHRIRTFPTASAVNTLRFEPSVLLLEAQVERLADALRDLCLRLRDQDEQRLMAA